MEKKKREHTGNNVDKQMYVLVIIRMVKTVMQHNTKNLNSECNVIQCHIPDVAYCSRIQSNMIAS